MLNATYQRILIVAEIGINHNGSLWLAKKLMDEAKGAGADFCKFQKRNVAVCYSPEELARPRESPFGETNGELKFGLELGYHEYEEIDRYSREIGLPWFASCWDESSVHFIAGFHPLFLKVASACLTDHALLRTYRDTGITVVMSTGMSTENEIADAVDELGPSLAYLLHCTATYPCAVEELNLAAMHTLQRTYPMVSVGFSSHAVSPWPALCAAAMGASMIEAHLTLDRTMFGSDQAASLEPHAFVKLVEEVRTFERARGDGVKLVYPSEEPVKAKLRRVR